MPDETAIATTDTSLMVGWRWRRWWLLWMPLWAGVAMLPAAVLLGAAARAFPDVTESVYGQRVYPVVSWCLGTLTGWAAPVSVAEVLLAVMFVAFVVWCGLTMSRRRQAGLRAIGLRRGWWKRGLARVVAFLGFAAMSFQVMWGLNYHRPGVAEQYGLAERLRQQPVETWEVLRLVGTLVKEAEASRAESGVAVMQLASMQGDLLDMHGSGWSWAEGEFEELLEFGTEVKTPVLWPVMEALGIFGIYWPFTGEANVNRNLPEVLLPFTAAHEKAHQRGVASEDEANFIGYQVCRASGKPYAAYSGSFAALLYALGALRVADPDAYEWVTMHDPRNPPPVAAILETEEERRVQAEANRRESERHQYLQRNYGDLPQISRDLWRDIEAVRLWREKSQSPVQTVSRAVNDTYLKANAQAGIVSYNRVVELLIAWAR